MNVYMYINPETGSMVKSSQLPKGIPYFKCKSEDNVNDFYVQDRKLYRKPASPDSSFVWDIETNKWVDPYDKEERLALLRKKRNQMLRDSDWTQLADVDLTPEKILEWKEYRRRLKDITKLDAVVWPKEPK